LHQLGCETDVADNGMIAIDMAHAKDYDLVFMDNQMPILDGISTTKHLRQSETINKDIKIVALTADNSAASKAKWYDANVDSFLSKPFTSQQMLFVLNTFLADKVVPKTPTLNAPEKPFLDASTANNMLEETTECSTADEQANEFDMPLTYLDSAVISAIKDIEAGTGNKMLPTLLDIFIEETTQKLPELQQAFASKNSDKLAATAHALKSMSGNVGAKELSVLAANIETNALINALDECATSVEQFEVILANTVEEFTMLVGARLDH
jgi:CheY-like chemotaxis protein